jgi:hypothetical protein
MRALHYGPETISLEPLDQEEDPERLLRLTQQYHEWLCRQSQSTDITIRYHQGRAKDLPNGHIVREEALTKYDKDTADKIYALFLGYEWLIDGYYGKAMDISKCTWAEVTQVRQRIHDEIEELLLSLRDETSFIDAPDVTVYPETA